MLSRKPSTQRTDHTIVSEWITEGSRVLDIGSDDGALLELLQTSRGVDGRGIELSQDGVNASVARGMAVIQGNADTDLIHYPDNSFDYTILSQTIQATYHPEEVLKQLLRIGKKSVVSLPNFGHWRARCQLFFSGRMPKNNSLPYEWYNTPNIHFCTISDFEVLCKTLGIKIEKCVYLTASGKILPPLFSDMFANLFASQAIFLLQNDGKIQATCSSS